MKRKVAISSIVFVLLLLSAMLGYFYWKNKYKMGPVGIQIIEEIDNASTEDCIIDLQSVTDFEWDKVVVVSADFWAAGYSDATVSEMWGFPYEVPEGFRSWLIFLNDNKIVHEESYAEYIEHSSKFNISIQSAPYYRILTSDVCEVVGGEADGHYQICVK